MTSTLTTAGRYRLISECLEQRKPPRCAECGNYGAEDCPQGFEVAPERRSTPRALREPTMDERVARLFASV